MGNEFSYEDLERAVGNVCNRDNGEYLSQIVAETGDDCYRAFEQAVAEELMRMGFLA